MKKICLLILALLLMMNSASADTGKVYPLVFRTEAPVTDTPTQEVTEAPATMTPVPEDTEEITAVLPVAEEEPEILPEPDMTAEEEEAAEERKTGGRLADGTYRLPLDLTPGMKLHKANYNTKYHYQDPTIEMDTRDEKNGEYRYWIAEVKIQDGEVLLNGNRIVKTENVPLLNGNKTLMELTQKKRELQTLLSERRAAYLADPSDENEETFFNASAELNKVSKRLTDIEKETLEFMSTIAEMTSDGKVLTYRQKEALKYYNAGDYDSAQAILSDAERENELQRAENRAELSRNEIQGYVNEDLLWIKTEMARGVGLTPETEEKIKAKYEKAIELCEKYDLDKRVLYDYANFLWLRDHKGYKEKAIQVAEKLKWYYRQTNT